MFGGNEINKCICGNNMQLVLLYCQINAKYMETGKTKRERLLYQHCHCHQLYIQLQKLQNVSFTFTEMTVIDYIKTIFISTGTRIWLSYLFGIWNQHVNHVDVDASSMSLQKGCNIPYHTIFVFCFAFLACKQIYFILKSRTNPGPCQKKYK